MARQGWLARLFAPKRRKPGRRNVTIPAVDATEVARARAAYQAFHSADPAQLRRVTLPDPPTAAWQLGRLVEVVYEPDGSSERKHVQFEHEFPDNGLLRPLWGKEQPRLLVSADGRQLIILRNKSSFRVTDRGIVG